MATRDEMRNSLLLRIGNRTDFDVPRIDAWLDDGLLDLVTKRVHLRSLETTSAPYTTDPNEVSRALPTDAFALIEVEDQTNHFVLSRFAGGWREFLWARQNTPASKPTHFIEFGGSRYWYPVIAAATTLVDYYYARPVWDGAPSSAPPIEEEWHYAIVLLSAAHAFRDVGDDARAEVAEADFDRWLSGRDTPTRRTRRTSVPPTGVRPHPSYHDPRTGV